MGSEERDVGRRRRPRGWVAPGRWAVMTVAAVLAMAPAAAMHISDGVLSGGHSLLWFALCVPFLAIGMRAVNRRKAGNLNYVPLAAMVGAAVFILSVFHVPVVLVPGAGSSSHPTGGALAAIIVGPFPAMVLNSIALLLQALFLAHGGLSSWGANTFSMGIVGVLVGYGAFRVLGRVGVPLFARAGTAAFLSNIATYAVAAFQLALDLHGTTPVGTTWAALAVAYLPTQGPLAVLDFILAGYMCQFMAQRRPDIAGQIGLLEPGGRLKPAAQGG
ncbi:MAG: energy-coupling factor ABC transporter permease [Armatimonadetes bacterium]|nr:energy-coupling factor ABC transporter permease [Armatimonadota bacterium]